MRRVIVTGGRAYGHRIVVWSVLHALHDERGGISCIIQGGADGVDRLARQWANFYRIPVVTYAADWPGLGKGAGPVRNEKMARESGAHLCVSFPGGHGTSDMVRRARDHEIQVMELNPA